MKALLDVVARVWAPAADAPPTRAAGDGLRDLHAAQGGPRPVPAGPTRYEPPVTPELKPDHPLRQRGEDRLRELHLMQRQQQQERQP